MKEKFQFLVRAEEWKVWEDTRGSPAVLHDRFTLYTAQHWPNKWWDRGAALQPHLHQHVKYLMGETCNTANYFLILYFRSYTWYWGRVLILDCVDQARQVDQTCFPCMENEGGAYLTVVVMKKSDSFCSAFCVDSSKMRYKSGRSWLLCIV